MSPAGSMRSIVATLLPACQNCESGFFAPSRSENTERSTNDVRIKCFVRGWRSSQRSTALALSPMRITTGVFSTATGTPVMRSVSTTSSAVAASSARLYESLASHSMVAMKRVPHCTPAYPMRKASTNPAASPMPPAHTTGSANGANSSSSARGSRGPAWPPARRLTAISPSAPPSRALAAHLASVTSWYTTPPTACTLSHTQRGSPNEVTKNRTPSSSAMSTHCRMRSM